MKLSILLLLAVLSSTYGYHILVCFIIPSHSHNQLGKGIVDALIKGGHTVTWITPYPDKVSKNPPPTLHILDVSHVRHYAEIDMMGTNKDRGLSFVKEFSENITRDVFTHKVVVDTLVNNQYDAVVTEVFFSDVLAGLPAVQQVPWIQLTAVPMMPPLEAQIDEVRSVNTIPLIFNEGASIPMTLKQRLFNIGLGTVMTIRNRLSHFTTAKLYEQLFAPIAARRNVKLPPFRDAFYNVSIQFTNTHESLFTPFITPPNVIGIAGYHIDENPPPLPKDLQDLLDKSKKGVVYFSMGSVLKSANFPAHTRKAILAKFAALPYTVLWKFEEKMEEELPPNVHVRKWFPQPSLLIHPNIKVFITHGGQLSSLEAVRAGVPLLAVPVFGDQPSNADRAKRAGFALKVDFSHDMADELDEKLRELLSNPSYTKRMKYLSDLFRDRPASPSKLVNHYVELAIKTKGAYHLRSPSHQYSWYELWMLDILLVALAALTIIGTLLAVTVKFIYRRICGKSCQPQKDLQDLLDKSKKGVVYFSMGSVLKSANFPAHTRKAILAKFAALPYTVLWKFEEKMEEELPPNVHVRKWFPQPSLLIHPNIKVFITHGGQLSSLEAVRAGVPLLAVPVFGDQPSNADRAKRAGFALKVDFSHDMADELDEKLRELLSNPSYTKRMKYLSDLFRDRPASPSKLVNHYVELAIKTKGAYHLRSPSHQYSWYELWMLDILLVALAALTITGTLLAVTVKFIYRRICGKSCQPQKVTNKKKKN